ncbi:MAG: FG-GAP-like repeat-containing protein [Planctomycetota bacterium]
MCPQFVDFNADGHIDIITATFEGTAFIVAGSEAGWKTPEHLTDAQGRHIVLSLYYDFVARKYDNAERSPEGQSNPKDHMVSTMVFDWDGDGDYDLLLGAKEGRLYLQLNEGKPGEPKFTGVNQLLTTADGKEFCVPGGLTAPRAVDWDKDGLTDLVCGSFAGGVYLYRNVGKAGAPVFAAPTVLIPVAVNKPGEAVAPTSGVYADPVDYDGDGDLDLLVGGYANWTPQKRELTEEEQKHLTEVQARMNTLRTTMTETYQKLRANGESTSNPEYRALITEYQALSTEIQKLVPYPRRDAGIWLYRRQ